MIGGWWRRYRKRRHCFHQRPSTGESLIESQMINMGMGKMFWCTHCEKTWFV